WYAAVSPSMKDFFLKDCATQENKIVTSFFLVTAKQLKPKKSGENYLAITLADRSGQIEAKMWDNVTDVQDTFETDCFVKVPGLINNYNNRFQLTAYQPRRLEDHEVDFSDYLPKTTKDIDQLWRTVGDFVAGFREPHLKALLEAFMADPEIAERY